MRARILAVIAVLALCAPAHGAAKPQITDPGNDARVLGARYDVVSALFATEGTKARVRGKWVYTPTKLTVAVTYAGNVAADQYSAQIVTFDVPECGTVYLEIYSAGTYGAADCVDDAFEFPAKRAGKTLTFIVPFATVGKSYLGPGVELSSLETWTNVADPVQGYESGDVVGSDGSIDVATTTKTYTIR